MAAHSSILAWRIPWTEEPDGQSMELQRVGHDWVANTFPSQVEFVESLPSGACRNSTLQSWGMLSQGVSWWRHSAPRQPEKVPRGHFWPLSTTSCHRLGAQCSGKVVELGKLGCFWNCLNSRTWHWRSCLLFRSLLKEPIGISRKNTFPCSEALAPSTDEV